MESYTFTRPDIELASYRIEHSNPKACIFIAHGMAEHSLRYEELAEVLYQAGYSVFMHDHRGHGNTPGMRGFFAETDGWSKCVEDMAAHIDQIKCTHPQIPMFLFGHSMGSFLSQEYLIRYSERVDAAILSGSNGKAPPIAKVGYYIALLESKFRGSKSPATYSEKISAFEFNKRLQPIRTPQDWLTRDKERVDAYIADPLCGFPCTTQFWLDMLNGVDDIAKPERQKLVRNDLPIFIFSGTMCAVGLYGKGIRNLINAYTQAGLFRIEYTLYPGGRHEMLNEINRLDVHNDILRFFDEQLVASTEGQDPSVPS
jgi:alpha-beta hydrolase superfamily lysophospholipase